MVLGITGGIGAGKTRVCDVFAKLEIPVYNSDLRSKQLLIENQELKKEVIVFIGPEAYVNGSLNRPFIASIIFNNPEKLEAFNGIVHPYVGRDFQTWIEANKRAPYLIKEAAILIESGAYRHVDHILLVTAPKEERITRVMLRDKAKREAVLSRLDKQMPEEEKKEYANFIVNNDGEMLILPQIIDIHKHLTSA